MILLVALSLSAPACCQQYIIKETFEDGDWDGNAELQCGSDCLQIVSPAFGARAGSTAAKLEWKRDLFNPAYRSTKSTELSTGLMAVGRLGWNEDIWCGFSVYLPDQDPDGFQADSKRVLIHQFIAWHSTCSGWDKSYGLTLYGDRLVLRRFYGAEREDWNVMEYTVADPIPRDAWVDFVIHVKFDRTGTTGLLQLWMDGDLKLDLSGIQIGRGCEDYGPYVKWGPYQFESSDYDNRVMYIDDIKLGVDIGYSDVAPGSPPGTPTPGAWVSFQPEDSRWPAKFLKDGIRLFRNQGERSYGWR